MRPEDLEHGGQIIQAQAIERAAGIGPRTPALDGPGVGAGRLGHG
jgi:hypothetical protein